MHGWMGWALVLLSACSAQNVPVMGQVADAGQDAGDAVLADGAVANDAPGGNDVLVGAADSGAAQTDASAEVAVPGQDVVDATGAEVSQDTADSKDGVDPQASADSSGAKDVGDATGDTAAACPFCPTSTDLVKEGEEVTPQTTLHLKAGPPCPGVTYKWTVTQPAGSYAPLSPNPSFPNPFLTADVAGEYEICLKEFAYGTLECSVCQKVLVVPNNAIHVELLWDTPGDLDQTDTGPTAGAEMDLHFANEMASGDDLDCDGKVDPWFSNPFDCFWFNPNPGWGSSNASANDDPSLDLDDTDGAGPENLNLASPDTGTYSVGVHYWNDHGFGASYATLNLYFLGVQVVSYAGVAMKPLDMWYVGKIHWPNVLTGGTGDPFETCYQSGDACLAKQDPSNPLGGKMWQATGKFCITHCYVNEAFFTAGGSTAFPLPACKKP